MQKYEQILLVSTSRADYSYIYPLLKKLQSAVNFRVELLIVEIKVAQEQPPYFDVEEAGEVIQIISDTSAQSIASNFSTVQNLAFSYLISAKPDLVFVLGDRYETLAVSIACYLARIPLAHMAGGDLTEGSLDDGFRNAITSLASIHFPTNVDSYNRLIAKSISSNSVFNVGSTSIDNIYEHKFNDLVLSDYFDISASGQKPTILVSFHPVTTDSDNGLAQLEALICALDQTRDFARLIFTGSNNDEGGEIFNLRIAKFCSELPQERIQLLNAGREVYLDLLRSAALICGNSSSGIYEAPYLETPTLNVGNRQRGRADGPGIVSVDAECGLIAESLKSILNHPPDNFNLAFGSFGASERIVQVLSNDNLVP